ncbi:MAG: LLM class flavin-dependent oxidoreductase, partial [Chloroflexi bacterium]|nr:LLM class flavin-dependent oxidoreductase [Chloroflexota bacterium]
MRFGFFMMPAHSVRDNPTLAFERDLQLIEYAESLGFEEFWVGEHHSGGWETIPAPDIFLAAAATRTKRIRLGTAVVNLPYHHPFHVAERMAFLDHLTYGRVMLGCGPGVLGPDMQLFDLDPRELRPMMNESLDIILKLYREEGLVWYEGDYWQIKGMEVQVKPYQQPHLPVYTVSSGSGNSIRVAAERGLPVISGVFTLPGAMPLGQQWESYEQIATEAGHRVSRDDWSLGNLPVYVAESNEQAYEDVAEGAMHELRSYPFKAGGKSTYEAYPGQPEEEITFEQVVRQRGWIIGDPDHCVRRIKDLQEESGGFGALLMLTLEWTSTEKWYRSLELFARYVMPQFNRSLRGIQGSYH